MKQNLRQINKLIGGAIQIRPDNPPTGKRVFEFRGCFITSVKINKNKTYLIKEYSVSRLWWMNSMGGSNPNYLSIPSVKLFTNSYIEYLDALSVTFGNSASFIGDSVVNTKFIDKSDVSYEQYWQQSASITVITQGTVPFKENAYGGNTVNITPIIDKLGGVSTNQFFTELTDASYNQSPLQPRNFILNNSNNDFLSMGIVLTFPTVLQPDSTNTNNYVLNVSFQLEELD